MHYYGDAAFGGMHMLWWLFWAGAMLFGVWMYEPVRRSQSRDRNSTPLEILQKRYASGQLSEEDYEKKKLRLERDAVNPSLPKSA
jgi:putative membrane protein